LIGAVAHVRFPWLANAIGVGRSFAQCKADVRNAYKCNFYGSGADVANDESLAKTGGDTRRFVGSDTPILRGELA
jgi:hypothetical protein